MKRQCVHERGKKRRVSYTKDQRGMTRRKERNEKKGRWDHCVGGDGDGDARR